MVEFLKNRNFSHITILDNASTYPPLLDWYATLPPGEVVRFEQNFGPHCLFSSGYIRQLANHEYIVYSDSDLELNPLMPENFLEIMRSLLLKYREKKIGLALRIDDVPPNCYKNCFTGSIEWEKQFWTDELEKGVYRALVDTTFCLLRHPGEHDLRAMRIAGDFTARYLPWYQEYASLTEEEKYFVEHASGQSNFRNGYFAWLEEQRQIEKRADKYFIAVYTNQVKEYCDKQFFSNLHVLSGGGPVHVIDNSTGEAYCQALNRFFREKGYKNFHLAHLDIPQQPAESRFQRSVCDSVNHLRNIYLQQTDMPFFLIIETDVIPPADLLDKLEDSMERLNRQDPSWGMIGGLYYPGFHQYDFDTSTTSLEKVGHCLSGCTVYKRSLVEKFPFRYDPADLAPFPDALISYDAGREYGLYNEHRIRCLHLHHPVNGSRASADIPYLLPHQLEPFNGDAFIEQEFLSLKERFNIHTVVETGTCFGSTTRFLATHFKKVISIEINAQYLEIASTRIGAQPHVHTYCGASEQILAGVLLQEAPFTAGTLFYLDARREAHCPLEDELRTIAAQQFRPVIAIRDVQVPGEPELHYGNYQLQPFTFEWLKPLIDDLYGAGGYDHYYNDAAHATEIKAGILYITPKG